MRLILIRMARFTRSSFFRDASTLNDSLTLAVLPGALLFGALAALICLVELMTDPSFTLGFEVSAFEIGGGVLGVLLVLRVNEGLTRWWEARKLWGGINNQCRNLAVDGLAYGPANPAWRRALIYWTITYAHACRRSLRDERYVPEVAALIGVDETVRLTEAHHMPSHAALVLARILWTAVDRLGMDRFAYLELDKERALLIDHIGGCERILTTPMPRALSVQVRRFLFAFLVLLPFGLIPKFNAESVRAARVADQAQAVAKHEHPANNARVWLVVPITIVVAFPLLALDKLGSDLQKPFWRRSINDLRLDTYTTNIERTLLALLDGPTVDLEIAEFLVAIDETPGEGGGGS
jgi:ion channel-forming bestrophin family protein